jgi:CheY-like chemotaxis protein
MPPDEFVNHIRDALTHLYDHVHLQSHPLADYLAETNDVGQVTRAQKLRRLLLNALEELSPPADACANSDAQIHYSALHYRYIDGLAPEQIAEILAISPRQTYRKIREGIEAVASLLWDRFQMEVKVGAMVRPKAAADRRSMAQATVAYMNTQAHPEILEVSSLVAGVVKDLQPYCERIGAEIDLQMSAKSLYIHADRIMLRQALLNLLTSGLGQTARPRILVNLLQERRELRLSLEIQANQESEERRQKTAEREGIGLEVAMRLFELQGCQIYQARAGEQWRVELGLPLAGPHHVLLIDDMPDMLDLFQRFTIPYAVEVTGAKSVDEATKLLDEFTPSLILLDVMLPRKDGWEFLQTLKANPATTQIPVIICSILNEPDLATALGADDYLRKPVRQEALLKMLVRWLDLDPAQAPVIL